MTGRETSGASTTRRVEAVSEQPQILDACCGGRMWWWDKNHPLAVYMDRREAAPGSSHRRPNWACQPSLLADFKEMPFEDECFQLVLFDPPHLVRDQASFSEVRLRYGEFTSVNEQEELGLGFSECWRVLAPGGTLVFKWAGPIGRVLPHFPADPVVGSRNAPRGSKGLGTRWLIFYKPLIDLAVHARGSALQDPPASERAQPAVPDAGAET